MAKINSRDFVTVFVFIFSGIVLYSEYMPCGIPLYGIIAAFFATALAFLIYNSKFEKISSYIMLALPIFASGAVLSVYSGAVTAISNIYEKSGMMNIICAFILVICAYAGGLGKFSVCRICNIFVYIMLLLFFISILPVFRYPAISEFEFERSVWIYVLVFADAYVLLGILENKGKSFGATYFSGVCAAIVFMIIQSLSFSYLFDKRLFDIIQNPRAAEMRLAVPWGQPEGEIFLSSLALTVKLSAYLAYIKKYSGRLFVIFCMIIFFIFKTIYK